ncbi:GmrSD restriction endonuclease domain-containing protein [Halomonas halocynthiae]|uniref:GmrSD restriction endonuclease domain-containing protein n=1 Tax=Halomonas halocynthiae TaxID=176290 RepID=UPI000417F936|nr:DUF262 domain-containing protein [Halomonas halocynthiae]
MEDLRSQIDAARVQVHTDAYPMSIGEISNLYEDGELDIHPEFQRVYRWSEEQKSKLIESILLGIPLPSIFVAQRDDGIWDVVDGLQRLSTIFSFLGKLRGEDGEILPPLQLKKTRYLPALEGKRWSDEENIDNEIHVEIKRIFKREKVDIKIIKKESEGDTKFELFQRLNTGGSKLSDQEVRNCMLLMINSEAFSWLQSIAQSEDFKATIPISEKQQEECYGEELALRFFVHRYSSPETRGDHVDVGPYLDEQLNNMFKKESDFDYDREAKVFKKTFSIFNKSLGEDTFKKFNHVKNKREGAVSLPVYEALTKGVSSALESGQNEEDIIRKVNEKSKKLTAEEEFTNTLTRRARPLDRMVKMNQLGVEVFNEG